MERLRELGGEQVRVDAEGFSIGAESDWRHDWHSLPVNEVTQEILVDPLHLARELLVDALDDSSRQSANRVGDGALQAVLRETLDQGVRYAGRGPDGEVKSSGVGGAGAIG